MALRGESVWVQNGKVYPWYPGMIFLNDSFEFHDDGYSYRAESIDLLVIRANGGLIRMGVRRHRSGAESWLTGAGIQVDAARYGIRIDECWSELKARRNLPSSVARLLALSALESAVVRLLDPQLGSHPSDSFSLAASRRMPEFLNDLCRHVRESGGRDVSAAKAAQLCGYSESRFRYLFRRYTGVPFHRYIDGCRIERARELTAQGLRPKQIAAELGFAHTSALSRWERTRNNVKSSQDEA